MKRVYASIIMIFLITLLDIYSHSMMLREKNELDVYLTAIQEHCKSGDNSSAVSETENLIYRWEESRKKLAFFINNRALDEISDSITKIEPLLISDSDEVIAEVEQIKQKLIRNHQKDLPYIYNIF